jgi:hypothetical protein
MRRLSLVVNRVVQRVQRSVWITSFACSTSCVACSAARRDDFTRLCLHLTDESLQQVDRHPRLPSINRCLSRVDLRQQAVRDTCAGDMSRCDRVLEALAQGADRRRHRTVARGLCLRRRRQCKAKQQS